MDFNLNAASFVSEKNFLPLDASVLYDVLILGGGPAGCTAAVYCMRKGVKTGIIVMKPGGQVSETYGIENYMGYRHIEGADLVEKFRDQVLQFGISYEEGTAVASVQAGTPHRVVLEDGRAYSARAIVAATGKSSRRLGVPGEEEFLGRGVAYCSTCDAPFFAGRRVAVAGGGNSAVEAAIDLARVATGVTVVQFLDGLTADAVLTESLARHPNVEIVTGHEVVRIEGDTAVSAVRVRERSSGAERDLAVDGIFVEIGLVPNSAPFRDAVRLNDAGEIAVDCGCRTSVPGIFAAGDVTDVPFKQIIVAAGEGAKAALAACEYVTRDGRDSVRE